ncbi:MAG: hypothetical protein WC119_01020 [Synergistaceae bacterium]
MISWYKIAQNKRREFGFDNAENVFYKVIEKQEAFQEDDELRVYHAFRDMNDAIITAKHGLSGQSVAERVYSYESNNNPKGLFITTNFETAKDFTTFGAIMEFTCRYKELEIPVWPGGGYTVQGGMSEYWDWDKLDEQRQQAILKQREKAKQSEYKAIANSSRPELAEMLMAPREYQALFIGNLNPSRINSFWVQKHEDTPLISDPWEELAREDFIQQYQYSKRKGFDGKETMENKHIDIKNKVYMPEDEFDATDFLKRLADDHGWPVNKILEIIKSWNIDEASKYLQAFLWPKQIPPMEQWLQLLFQ